MIRTTVRDADVPMRKQQDFRASALSGNNRVLDGVHYAPTLGRLPDEYRASAMTARYVVFSYETPIAWVDATGAWVQPPTRYSVTTSKHQGVVRRVTGIRP